MSIFYVPVVIYIVGLVVRYRGLTFTAVNPGLPGSGFIGENKSDSLLTLQHHSPEMTAKTCLIMRSTCLEEKCLQSQYFMQQYALSYPVVLKPDFGQRGIDVEIVHNETDLRAYLATAACDTVLQEYIVGVEFGVFYVRQPDQLQGSIFSLTHKCFPYVVGDGVRSLEQLICEHPRLHYMAAFLFEKHQAYLHTIPVNNEQVDVVTLGSHCRGSLFLEGESYLTPSLEEKIDVISQHITGFYFGRYDIRAESIEAFQRGECKVIEVNGVTSESTNMYDPRYSLFDAYRILFNQWQLAFQIGQKNIHLGHVTMSVRELINKVRIMNSGT
ncbi:MAG: hypothetical protein ACI8VC_000818 [Candidatus Endobugula sp.]|jgi:hypothetical protein